MGARLGNASLGKRGAAETGDMSTMIAGKVAPGGGRGVYQFMNSAISAACAASIAMLDALQRRTPAWSVASCSANAFIAVSFARRGRPVRP